MVDVVPLLAALGGSAIGGVAGARMQIRHERKEAFRERMLAAADDAATAVGSAVTAAGSALSSIEGLMIDEETSAQASAAHDRARELATAADSLIGRVDLLFGFDSGLGDHLRECRRLVHQALVNAGPTPPELDRAFEFLKRAEDEYRSFIEGARASAERYGETRWRR